MEPPESGIFLILVQCLFALSLSLSRSRSRALFYPLYLVLALFFIRCICSVHTPVVFSCSLLSVIFGPRSFIRCICSVTHTSSFLVFSCIRWIWSSLFQPSYLFCTHTSSFLVFSCIRWIWSSLFHPLYLFRTPTSGTHRAVGTSPFTLRTSW